MAGSARAQVSDVTKPSFGSWGCDRNAACMASDTQYRQQVIAQNTQVAMQQAAAQSQVNSAQQCVQTGPTSYTCQLGQTLQAGGQYLPSGYVQNRPQVPVCQIAQNGQVMSNGACADPQTGQPFAPCTQGVWVRRGVNNFECVFLQPANTGQLVGYPPAGAYQPQVGYTPQQPVNTYAQPQQQTNALIPFLAGVITGAVAHQQYQIHHRR
jgi:hypothetical protein